MSMSETYQGLRNRYQGQTCLPLTEVIADWFPRYHSPKTFLMACHAGLIDLRVTKAGFARSGTYIVYLRDLANWLDSHNPDNTAAHQAA